MDVSAQKLRIYYATAIFSLLFAIVGFSYNAWRLEVSEDNSNIRIASFELLTELAELEQIIYFAHYDKDPVQGSPRRGWVKIGLIVDLSTLIATPVELRAGQLKQAWASDWAQVTNDRNTVDRLIKHIDAVRDKIKASLITLK